MSMKSSKSYITERSDQYPKQNLKNENDWQSCIYILFCCQYTAQNRSYIRVEK